MWQWMLGTSAAGLIGLIMGVGLGYYFGWHRGWDYGYRDCWNSEKAEIPKGSTIASQE